MNNSEVRDAVWMAVASVTLVLVLLMAAIEGPI